MLNDFLTFASALIMLVGIITVIVCYTKDVIDKIKDKLGGAK